MTQPGQKIVLTATANESVTGTDKAIEIFDLATQTVVGACMQGSQCIVAYSAWASIQDFAAYVTQPVKTPPKSGSVVVSNRLTVNWVGVVLKTNIFAVAPGRPLTMTATVSISDPSGYALQFFELATGHRLAYCANSATCSMALTQPNPGSHPIVATFAKLSTDLPAPQTLGQSDALTVTWLEASVYGRYSDGIGGNVYLTATTNADLSNTPWSLAIVDDHGNVVGKPCKSGDRCSAQVSVGSGATPSYGAIVGVAQSPSPGGPFGRLVQQFVAPPNMVNIQVRSGLVKPSRLLWGVDSCKSMNSIYGEITGGLGTPDFWGRYLTNTVCPGISGDEVATAHTNHIGILPIYNDFVCSDVVGYWTAKGYALSATAAARSLGIPQGTGLAIDIEPPGEACPGAANIDSGFIHGWVDGMQDAHYVPVFYGDGTAGSQFAVQWCVAVNAMPYIAQNSFVWSFQPSLLGGFSRGSAPSFAPNQTGCAGHSSAWQYQIGSSSVIPDVDQDEAMSDLPLWYP